MVKYRVLLLMPELFFGGAETQFRYLIEKIDKDCFELYVLVEHSNNRNNDLNTEKYVRDNVKVQFEFLNNLTTEGTSVARYASYLRANIIINHYIKKYNPQIVVVYSRIGLKLLNTVSRYKIPSLYSERNVWNNPSRFWRENRFFLNKCSKIVCNSIDAQKLFKSHNIDAEYIPNGIEIADVLDNVISDYYRIVVPARITPIKNQRIVIEALKYMTTLNLKICFIGVIEDKTYYDELIKLCKCINVSEIVEFKEFTTRVEDIYREADLIILPSFVEGLSNVILESYMYGRLVLLSNISQNINVGSEKQMYFNPKNPKDLADKIEILKNMKKKEIDILTGINRDFVIANYDIKYMVNLYEKILKAMIN
ncbi:MAG: glycosyltransferase [Hungatella sp.]|nr:glycosyltransferase [Hungatella sp.]